MRIVGIDPGLQITGYGVLDWKPIRPVLVDGGVIRLDPKRPLADRLVELETELDALLEEHRPDVCAVEQLYSHYAHPRTAILMGHARGVILLLARKRGIRLEQFAANRVKQSLTGHGHASKAQVQRAVQSQWNLPKLPEPPDVADALAVAFCCGMHMGRDTTMGATAVYERSRSSTSRPDPSPPEKSLGGVDALSPKL